MSFKKIIILFIICISMVLYSFQVYAEDKIPLNINDFLQTVCDNNPAAMQKKYDWLIKAEMAKKEWAAFEPDLILSYTHKDSNTQNTAEQYFDRSASSEFDEKTDDSKIEIKGLVPVAGTEYALGAYWNTTSNNLVEGRYQSLGASIDEEYQNTLELKLTQPLLKNAWEAGTMSKIKIAALEDKIAYTDYQKNIMTLASKALSLYWDLYYSVKQVDIFQDSERIALELLNIAKERFKAGKIGKGDVYKAETGLAVRRSLSSQAKQQLQKVRNHISTVISESSERGANAYVPVSNFSFIEDYEELDYEQSLKNAMKNDPAYQISLKIAQKEDIRLSYAENQHLPQVDLTGSYSWNSLDTSDSWKFASGDYPTWSLGLMARIPLGGGVDTKRELRAAQLRKKQAQLRIKADMVRLTNDLDTVLGSASQTIAQLEEYNKNVEMNTKMLEIQLSHLKAGKSDIQKVLNVERELNIARKEELKADIQLEKVGINLNLIEGTLLQKYGISPEGLRSESIMQPAADIYPAALTPIRNLSMQKKPESLKPESLKEVKTIKQAVEDKKKEPKPKPVHWVDGIQPVLIGWVRDH